MDEYTILDTQNAYINMVDQENTLDKIKILWYVSFGFVLFEVIMVSAIIYKCKTKGFDVDVSFIEERTS